MSNEVSVNLFVVLSPSGGGKTSLCRMLLSKMAPTIRFSVSHTTRPPRAGETAGVDYHFVAEKEFQRMIEKMEMAEWAQVHQHYYGTSKGEIQRAVADGVDLFLDIDWQGAEQIAAGYPPAVRIFVMPPGMEELRRRLASRGTDSPEQIQLRLTNALQEMVYAEKCDYIVVNQELTVAAQNLEAIVRAQRCRRENQLDAIRRFDST